MFNGGGGVRDIEISRKRRYPIPHKNISHSLPFQTEGTSRFSGILTGNLHPKRRFGQLPSRHIGANQILMFSMSNWKILFRLENEGGEESLILLLVLGLLIGRCWKDSKEMCGNLEFILTWGLLIAVFVFLFVAGEGR